MGSGTSHSLCSADRRGLHGQGRSRLRNSHYCRRRLARMPRRQTSRIAARLPPARGWRPRRATKAISITAAKHHGGQTNRDLGSGSTSPREPTTEQRAGQKKLRRPHAPTSARNPIPCAPAETQPPREPRSAPLPSRGTCGVKPTNVTVSSGETAVEVRRNPTTSGHTQSEGRTASDARANSNAGLDPRVARHLLFATSREVDERALVDPRGDCISWTATAKASTRTRKGDGRAAITCLPQ